MDGITCDMCGKPLLADEDTRYIAEVKIYAAYDVMELTTEDLEKRDIAAEIEKAIKAASRRDAKELEEEVFAHRKFDLCPSCRKQFLGTLPQ